ncbi:hypothetical protein ACFVTE_09045 [Arthrobacter sp. NPDC058097]|uniref:hypothetical protein n=1 Tax=Arthrobacter sp. NPDC058097 TaxID=3346340 RepID=UPI0036DE2959
MKTRAALALSVAGIVVTGSAALAVNTQVLNTTPAGTGNANSILLPDDTGNSPAPAAVVSAKAVPNATPKVDGGSTTPPPVKTVGKAESESQKGGRRTTASAKSGSVADRKGGTLTKKSDADPAQSQLGGTAGSQTSAGSAGSQPGGTAGTQTNAGSAVVSVPPGDDKGRLRTAPEPGDDKGKQRNAADPGEDSGGQGSDD